MEIAIILIVLFGAIIYTFSSAISEIPFFPTNNKDLPKIIHAMKLKNDQTVVDLGAGTGTVIFAAALDAHHKGLNTTFVAIDINITLVAWMYVLRLFHPNRARITIILGDLFKTDYRKLMESCTYPLFYLYVSPWLTDKLGAIIQKAKLNGRVVSYYYPMEKHTPLETINGLHKIYVYKI